MAPFFRCLAKDRAHHLYPRHLCKEVLSASWPYACIKHAVAGQVSAPWGCPEDTSSISHPIPHTLEFLALCPHNEDGKFRAASFIFKDQQTQDKKTEYCQTTLSDESREIKTNTHFLAGLCWGNFAFYLKSQRKRILSEALVIYCLCLLFTR